jgi:ADP-heptose:LPS heptosyltransferase
LRPDGDLLAVTRTLVMLRALGLGDLLTGVPALRALARAFPNHRRILAAPRTFEPLIEFLDDAVHEVVDTPGLDAPLDESLRGADVAVNLHGRGPESHRLLLAAEPRELIAFCHPDVPDTGACPEWRVGEWEVRRWCRLLAESGIPADESDLDLPVPPEPPPAVARGATVIHPGAASAARRWPLERFAAVARAESQRGHEVVITGGPDERCLGVELATLAGLPAENVLAGQTDLRQLASVVAAAARLVCGDTGVAHLATAFGTPSVVLFGPTPPSAWGPPADRPRHRVLWAGQKGDPHADLPHAGLLRLSPAEVIAELDQLPEAALG